MLARVTLTHAHVLLDQVRCQPLARDRSAGNGGKCLAELVLRVPGVLSAGHSKVTPLL